ncbi:response regulator [Spirosoma migulaei]
MVDNINRPALNRPFPILIVEDNADYQFLLKFCLQKAIPQAKPTFFSTAPEALAFLKQEKSSHIEFPKLVFLDIYLPYPEAGWQLLKTIRLDWPTLPVIVLSIFQDPDHVKTAYDLGAHSFLGKPTNFLRLISDFEMLYKYWGEVVTLYH